MNIDRLPTNIGFVLPFAKLIIAVSAAAALHTVGSILNTGTNTAIKASVASCGYSPCLRVIIVSPEPSICWIARYSISLTVAVHCGAMDVWFQPGQAEADHYQSRHSSPDGFPISADSGSSYKRQQPPETVANGVHTADVK